MSCVEFVAATAASVARDLGTGVVTVARATVAAPGAHAIRVRLKRSLGGRFPRWLCANGICQLAI